MLSEQQYELLKPFRADVLSRSMERASRYMNIANTIQQQIGIGSICFSCDGSKISAKETMYNLINEYEKQYGIPA